MHNPYIDEAVRNALAPRPQSNSDDKCREAIARLRDWAESDFRTQSEFVQRYGRQLNYSEQLLCREWMLRRAEILFRDRFRCQRCGCVEYRIGSGTLHIHHRLYILGRAPWEYSDDQLQALCSDCHEQVHATGKVRVYVEVSGELLLRDLRPFYRCHGAGYFPQWEHIEAGVCFRCRGKRFEEDASENDLIGGVDMPLGGLG